MSERETNEKEENLEKTRDMSAEPVEGKECPKCGKLEVVRTTPNAGWIRFQCLSCGWKRDIYTGF
jgi:ribosomal protein L37AE/L43A